MDVVDVVVIGPPGAGKTSLCMALSGLSKDIAPTVMPELYAVSRGDVIVHLWDTPGQGKYSSVSKHLIGRAALAVSCSADGNFVESPIPAVMVRTKNDLNAPWFHADIATSAHSGENVSILKDMIMAKVAGEVPAAGGCCTGCTAKATHTKTDAYALEISLKP